MPSRSAADAAARRGLGALLLLATLVASCGGPAPLGGGGQEAATPGTTPAPAAVLYTRYAAADAVIVAYCAGCHSRSGADPDHARAHQVLPLDGYDDWRRGATVIAAVLDDARPDGNVMPPPTAPSQPSRADRSLLLDWTRRGSPDTADGR